MLQIQNVGKNFGGLQALTGVSFSVGAGEFVGLIGPNGSGKTTLINCISGLYAPETGRIQLGTRTISGLSAHRIYHLGIGRTFQITKVFHRLTVLENLIIPVLTERKMGRREIDERAKHILARIQLTDMKNLPAGKLSGGQQKLLETGMVMMPEPQVLLLDEPFGGVHVELKAQLDDYLREVNTDGRTVILVSHEMTSVFQICRRLIVLDNGTLIADGTTETVRNEESVIKAYLGGGSGAA